MKFRKDYAAANVPMLPVEASPAAVARKIFWYSCTRSWRTTSTLVQLAGSICGVLAAALRALTTSSRRTGWTPASEPAQFTKG